MNNILTVSMYLTTLFLTVSAQFIEPTEGRVFLSGDHGISWTRADQGLPKGVGIRTMVLHKDRIFAGTVADGMWELSRGGWSSQSQGLPDHARIVSLASYHDLLFAGVYKGGLYYSADNGDSWKRAGDVHPTMNVRALAYSAGGIYAGTDDGIYSVTLHGQKWERVLGGLQVNALSASGAYVYAATDRGVVRSNDGANWETIYNGRGIYRISSSSNEILLYDFSGAVYTSQVRNPVFINQDVLFPGNSFRLTPASPKMLIGQWEDVSFVQTARRGLPDKIPFTILLRTPIGLLTAAANEGC